MTLLLCFLAGAFLVNAVPHLVHGVSGRPFPTPFARPPGKGLSPPLVNVMWSAANVVAAGLLLAYTPRPPLSGAQDWIALGAGGLLLGLGLAWHFGRVQRERGTGQHR